jgi:hypothetical protein
VINPAGWYPQPDGQQRYWDGQKWTGHRAQSFAVMKPPKRDGRNWFLRHKVLTAIGAVLLLGMFSGLAEGGTDAAEAAATVATGPKAASMTADEFAADRNGPPDQRALVEAVVAGGINYSGTTNELKQRLIEKTRDRAACAAVPGGKAKGWVGQINRLTVNTQGAAILEVQIGDIGDGTKLSTQPSAFSGGSDNSMIPFDSDPYDALANLGKGDWIQFSGMFIDDHGTCLWQRTLGLSGGMKSPNFTFRFDVVTGL